MMHVTAPQRYATDALLRDGGSIHIRAIRSDDKQRLLALFERLSSRSVYFRFFQTKQRLTDEELRYFTELDFTRNVALAATLREGEAEHIIGVGRYFRLNESGQPTTRAEVAFTVADAYQGKGVGTLLLEHLAAMARLQGIDTFEAYVLGENNRMLQVFEASGFTVQRSLESGVFHISFPTAETPRVRAASTERERVAAAQSIRAFLNPRSIAVVGVSQRGDGVGATLLANLQRAGFAGRLYPIHPHATALHGLPAFPRVSAVGAPVDLALIAVPAAAVEEIVADCAAAGVHGVVVISSGFAEASGAGREAEQRLRALARASGMRLVGPNCMGLLNTDPQVSLNATFTTLALPPAGIIGMLSQSGALGLAMLDYVQTLHVGLSTFVSVGNRADVSSNDVLAYWADDPRTSVIVLYLESFGNPRWFARIAPDVAQRKPIIAVKSGRSAAGNRAAASHSAALATSDTAAEAVAAAERLGYPLVAKIISPDVLHKRDVGGVILNLETPAAVASAVDTLVARTQRIGARLDGILLQRQVSSGIEALVGVTTDPMFGPLLVCGLGGTLVEVLHDVVFRLTPVSDSDAAEMLTKLRANVLLDGYRGAPPGDREALIGLVLRISALVESVPELQEFDLNPVKVLTPGAGIIALDGRMRLAPLG